MPHPSLLYHAPVWDCVPVRGSYETPRHEQSCAAWRQHGRWGTGWELSSASSAHHGQLWKRRKRPGSLRCPLLTLCLMPAAQWPQEIGSWAGNRAGNRQQQNGPSCIWCSSRRYWVGIQDRLAGEKPQGPGRCPSGTLAVSEQTPTSSTDPFCHYDGPPSISMLGTTEGPCQSSSRAHPPLLQHLCCPVPGGSQSRHTVGDQSTGPGLSISLSPQGLCPALPCPVWNALLGRSGASCLW